MKFLWALIISLLLAVKGEPSLLLVGFLTSAVAFAKLGGLPTKSH